MWGIKTRCITFVFHSVYLYANVYNPVGFVAMPGFIRKQADWVYNLRKIVGACGEITTRCIIWRSIVMIVYICMQVVT